MYILDTDHIGVLQRQSEVGYQTPCRRIASHSQTDFFVAIVSFHEEILGWNAYIAHA